MEQEAKGELLQEEVFRALKNADLEEELETRENGALNLLYQNLKENPKQIKKQTSCILVKHAKNQNTDREEEINEQEN